MIGAFYCKTEKRKFRAVIQMAEPGWFIVEPCRSILPANIRVPPACNILALGVKSYFVAKHSLMHAANNLTAI